MSARRGHTPARRPGLPTRLRISLLVPAVVLLAAGCTTDPVAPSAPSPTASPARPATTRLAVITDFGACDEGQRWVSEEVAAWDVLAVFTAGDNTQKVDDCDPYSESVWGYWDAGSDGRGRPPLWPALGNHDYTDAGAGLAAYHRAFPYLDADADPLRRWYVQDVGDVTVFVLDSEVPPGDLARQRDWLRRALGERQRADPDGWQVVILHRPPFTSGSHRPNVRMRPSAGWDYGAWGADLVVSGHQHVYEDVLVGGLHYLTAGIGASSNNRSCPDERVTGSRTCLSGPGAVRLTATPTALTVEYVQPDDRDAAVTTDYVVVGR